MTDATAIRAVVAPPAMDARHGPLRAGAAAPGASAPKPKLLDQVRDAIRTRHYSYRTEEAYVGWIRRFILFHNKRHPAAMGKAEIEQFLTALAVKRNVAASTQNKALAALLFLYKDLLYGYAAVRFGLRLMECIRLRVKDIDFMRNEILVREGKGNKDRVTMLATRVRDRLLKHLEHVGRLHARDLAADYGRVQLLHPRAQPRWARRPESGRRAAFGAMRRQLRGYFTGCYYFEPGAVSFAMSLTTWSMFYYRKELSRPHRRIVERINSFFDLEVLAFDEIGGSQGPTNR